MNTSKFYKKLTQAEVGQTKTHEVYIRMPNDFDYESFFNNTHVENGSVIEVNFTAPTTSFKTDAPITAPYDYRFVFFANSNKEKRIPGLGPLFKSLDIVEGDVVCIERIENGETPKFSVAFYRADQVQISPASVLISADDNLVASNSPKSPLDEPLQIIFYGAPGTGKSFKIDGITNDDNTIRTTFHPDTDYSTFVGAYKPTMENVAVNALVGTNVQKATGVNGHPGTEKKIVYKYVPQAFLKAYVAAWKDLENPYFLVIEEINRGNCAQIFGDLFQLLDRNSQGASSYAIHADEDIAQFLRDDENGFANLDPEIEDAIRSFVLVKDNRKTEAIGADILSGKKLLLPPNLRIWATMNTSDQSLFPIDSAFKRRWNWEYIPIKFFDNDSNPSLSNRSFAIGTVRYSWADFLRKINPIISELTDSADKQMGFFFAKPDKKSDTALKDNDVLSEKVFLNKVLFYLWTDVLKDFNIGREEFKKPDGKTLEFADFFEEGNDYLASFVEKLGVAVVSDDEAAFEKSESGYKPISVTMNGQTFNTITGLFYEIMRKAASMQPYAEIEKSVKELLPDKELTIKPIEDAASYQKENRWNKTPLTALDGQAFVITNQWKQSDLAGVEAVADHFNTPFQSPAE